MASFIRDNLLPPRPRPPNPKGHLGRFAVCKFNDRWRTSDWRLSQKDSLVYAMNEERRVLFSAVAFYWIIASILITTSIGSAQKNFECPDDHGFYPHRISCDKYWKCDNGNAELKTCGNGLAFQDTDPKYLSENCDYLHNVDCGNRTLGVSQQNSSTPLREILLDYFSSRKRWWDDGQLFCGRSAPLYEGFYPICNPFNPKTPCCSYYGHCGSSPQHCNCTGCVDYSKNPELLVKEPVRPTREIRWHLLSEEIDWSLPVCGPYAPPIGGYEPICNPDDDFRHCCSKYGFCGSGPEFCDCEGCKDFRKISLSDSMVAIQGKSELRSIILDYLRTEKRWWAWEDEPKKRGMCGKLAPLVNGYYPVCNPFSPNTRCCNEFGYCVEKCNCSGCVDYEMHPEKLLEEPIRPNQEIQWHLISDEINWDLPMCGPKAPKVNGSEATCNAHAERHHCCSAQGYCGHGPQYCNCKGCKDFRKIGATESETPRRSSVLRDLILGYFNNTQNIRWWTKEDDPKKVGLCGKIAPLYKGHYPVCNPFNPKTSCCSDQGRCGSSAEHCSCARCVGYSMKPEMLLTESGRPSKDILWHTPSDNIDRSHPKCGPRAPPINGQEAICNPDDDYKHCCSSHGFCGHGPKYCDCEGCVNFRTLKTSLPTITKSTTHVKVNNKGSSNQIIKTLTNETASAEIEIGETINTHSEPNIDHN